MAEIYLKTRRSVTEDPTAEETRKKSGASATAGPSRRPDGKGSGGDPAGFRHPKIRSKKETAPPPTTGKERRADRDNGASTSRLSCPKVRSRDEAGRFLPSRRGKAGRLPGSEPGTPEAAEAPQRRFKFRAIKHDGDEKSEVTGVMLGEDEQDVTRRLQQTDHVIVSVREGRRFDLGSRIIARLSSLRPARVPLNDLVMFTQQLATMVEAGNPLLGALIVLQEQCRNPVLAGALADVIGRIRQGASLSEALGRHPLVFDDLYVNLARAGEASGRLALNLSDLAAALEEAAAVRNEIVSAMTYPVLSLLVIFGVSAGILLGIIPKFQDIFDGMQLELPWLTEAVLGLSNLLRHHFLLLAGIIVAAAIAFARYRKSETGKLRVDRLKLRAPIFGPLVAKVAMGRVCNTFALLLRSGVSTLAALEIAGEAAGNRVYSREIERIGNRVREGASLSAAFAEGKVFSFMVSHMLSVGEESGNIDHLLEKLSDFFKAQVRATIKRLTSSIEPVMIVTMGLVVGTMVLAIFMPIIELQKSMRGGG